MGMQFGGLTTITTIGEAAIGLEHMNEPRRAGSRSAIC